MGTLLLFIVVLSLLVFVHELGHFLVAKKTGMKVEEFGFGFPPRLFGVKKGDTLYSINWIPMGGFVRIKGESGEYKNDPDSFASKKIWQRFCVVVAGVVMNLLLAVVLLSIGFMLGLPQVIDERLPASARVSDSELTIMTVVTDSPAAKAGVQKGDIITSIDGQIFSSAEEVRTYISEAAAEGVLLQVKSQDQKERTYQLTSEPLTKVNVTGIGIGFIQTGLVSYPFFQALVHGVVATATFTDEVVRMFAKMIVSLVSGQGIGIDFSGPIGIAVVTGRVAALGFVYLLQFTALLSVNLAVINLLPIPALDGGHVLFLLIEKCRGRAVNEQTKNAVHNLGFMLIMVLVVLVTYKDFVNFGDEILGAFRTFFTV